MKRSTAILLVLGIVVLLAANSTEFFFRQPYYEWWDLAANSLSILRAKHFAQLYGAYSRYVFYHPGPAFFYVQAFGEWLFFDRLHWVPTPFQGQVLINLCLMAGFFVAALDVFAGWLPARRRRAFLCAALVVGTLHFTQMAKMPSLLDVLGGPSAFLSPWPVHAMVLPFLCLLTAGASVGAGRGRDLPLLIIAGGFLIEHVAQPLFVGSTAVVAYAGLVVTCARRERRAANGNPETGDLTRGRWLLAAWRAHRGAHVLAAALLFLFALPMLVDLTYGRHSNLAAILRHLHAQESDRKHLTRSFAYFLLYAAYVPYQAGQSYLGRYDLKGFLAHVRAYGLFYVAWLAVLLLVLQTPLAYLWTRWRRRVETPPGAAVEDARYFLAWAALVVLLNVALSLYWGTRQDGEMLYYNSWFNFAIYYFGALIAASVLCTARLREPAAVGSEAPAGTVARRWPDGRWVGVGAVVLTVALCAGRLRVHVDNPAAAQAMHENIQRAIARSDASQPGVCKVLFVPDDYWTMAVAVGLELARAGDPFVVRGRWKNTFGSEHDWQNLSAKTLGNGLRPWYIDPRGTVRPGVPTDAPIYPLRFEAALMPPTPPVLTLTPPTLELSKAGGEADIDFALKGNAANFALAGWASPEAQGDWSEEGWAALAFRPQEVEGSGVEVTVDGWPFTAPAHGLTRQRLRLYFDGTPLGPEQSLTAGGTLRFVIPAAAWNAAAGKADAQASLAFELPDAVSPATLDPTQPNGDPRDLGIFFQRVRLRVMP